MKDSPIRILIVEDEFITQETLRAVLQEMGYAISGSAMNAQEALSILEKGGTDFAIFDINIKGDKDGIWLANQVREKYGIPFIFLTAFGDQPTVQRAIAEEPYGYLVKPFNKVDVFTAIEVALKNYAKHQAGISPTPEPELEPEPEPDPEPNPEHIVTRDSIFIRDSYMYVKLRNSDILYIKSDKNYLEVHLPNKRHLVRGKMSDFIKRLPAENFLQIHRSHVVNLEAITSFGGGYVKIGDQELPLGNPYKEELKRRISVF